MRQSAALSKGTVAEESANASLADAELKVARDLDLRPDMLRRWKRQLEADPRQAFPGQGRLKPDDDEMRRLRRELDRVREERDILKKALAIFSSPSR